VHLVASARDPRNLYMRPAIDWLAKHGVSGASLAASGASPLPPARHGRDGNAIRISTVAFTTLLTDSAEGTQAACQALAGFFRIPPEAVPRAPLGLVGTPAEVAAEISRRRREWDVSQVVFSVRERSLVERIAREVIPLVE
jgi:hypothetical protein